jgi:peptidoglycan hydrolase-like protein with peptidoglycan-binding domain
MSKLSIIMYRASLREAIQNELSAQLGRTHKDFRIWQDKSAISLGTLWEKQISQGINESVFFIPIITRRALRSQHCAYEFQSFLARESELGRDDLVFPILYIPVPALEDEKLWRDEPILRIVATLQYLDWRELRHHDPRSIEVQQKLEWYCRGITNALHKTWSPRAGPFSLSCRARWHLSRQRPFRRLRQGRRPMRLPGCLFKTPMMPQHFGVLSHNFRIAHGVKMPKDILPPAWNSVKDSKDPDQLRQFVRQFPDSLQRNDAEARFGSLLAAQAAWNFVRDSKDPDKLRQFVLQFPDSSERPVAEQRIASLVATLQGQTVVSPPDTHALTRSLQVELQRVGCFNGDVNGEFDDATKAAWRRFIKLTSISMPDDVSSDAINTVHGIQRRVCPLVCPHGKHAEGEVCVANAPPPKASATKTAAPKAATARATSAPTPRAAARSVQSRLYECHGTIASLSGSAMSRETCGY